MDISQLFNNSQPQAPVQAPTLTDQIIKIMREIKTPLPANATPIQIAQHANAMVRLSNTAETQALLKFAEVAVNQEVQRHSAETQTLLMNNVQ